MAGHKPFRELAQKGDTTPVLGKSPETVERLKDVATDLELVALKATVRVGPDAWMHIEVREAYIYGDSQDGWDVEITKRSI